MKSSKKTVLSGTLKVAAPILHKTPKNGTSSGQAEHRQAKQTQQHKAHQDQANDTGSHEHTSPGNHY
jgi:hypothetical protein